MITGAKIGAIIGRKRAFAIGCVIYGCGSFTTALAPNLPVLLLRLVVPRRRRRGADPAGDRRARRRELPGGAAAGGVRARRGRGRDRGRGRAADRRLLHDLLLLALGLRRRGRARARDPAARRGGSRTRRSRSGRSSTSSARCSRRSASALLVFGVLRSGEWGWIQPKAGGPSWAGLSPTVWLILGGLFVIWLFFRWQARRESRGQEPLVRPAMLRNRQLTGGLTMFFFQYLVQAGFFFVVPLYLSVALGLSALDDRRAAAAALGHAAGRGDRHPALPPERLAAARRPRRPPRAARRAPSCCSAGSTRTPGPRSSSCRCCSSASGSARSPRSSARSPSRPSRTTRAPRSAVSRTR